MRNKREVLFNVLLLVTALSVFAEIAFILLGTPQAQAQAGGLAQKIFYFHVPSAYAMYLSGLVCCVASVGYLLKGTETRNAIAKAGAEAAVMFGMMVLTSGPLWAKKAWGVYWTWDPRLTTSLLSVLIYVAVVLLRTFSGDGRAERTFAAALGVLGTVNLPIIHYSVKKWGGNHPVVVTGSGGGLGDPAMYQALTGGFIVMTLLAIIVIWLRTRAALLETRSRQLEQLVAVRS